MHKLTVQYSDPADPAAFDAHYQQVHVPLAAKIPGLRRFTVSKPRGLGAPAPYLVAELWFDDVDALNAGLGSAEGAAAAADVQTFAIGSVVMFAGDVEEAVAS
ncbi:MAG TPA: EthD family reductase [Trebonia sp.]|nr:EthD family reductase [Trebonia sp.]